MGKKSSFILPVTVLPPTLQASTAQHQKWSTWLLISPQEKEAMWHASDITNFVGYHPRDLLLSHITQRQKQPISLESLGGNKEQRKGVIFLAACPALPDWEKLHNTYISPPGRRERGGACTHSPSISDAFPQEKGFVALSSLHSASGFKERAQSWNFHFNIKWEKWSWHPTSQHFSALS